MGHVSSIMDRVFVCWKWQLFAQHGPAGCHTLLPSGSGRADQQPVAAQQGTATAAQGEAPCTAASAPTGTSGQAVLDAPSSICADSWCAPGACKGGRQAVACGGCSRVGVAQRNSATGVGRTQPALQELAKGLTIGAGGTSQVAGLGWQTIQRPPWTCSTSAADSAASAGASAASHC